MPIRTTVRLPEDLLRRAKKRAHEEGRTLTSLIADGLVRVLGDSARMSKLEPVSIPVSRAKGGLQPGVDLDDSASLLDRMEDR